MKWFTLVSSPFQLEIHFQKSYSKKVHIGWRKFSFQNLHSEYNYIKILSSLCRFRSNKKCLFLFWSRQKNINFSRLSTPTDVKILINDLQLNQTAIIKHFWNPHEKYSWTLATRLISLGCSQLSTKYFNLPQLLMWPITSTNFNIPKRFPQLLLTNFIPKPIKEFMTSFTKNVHVWKWTHCSRADPNPF